MHRPEALDDLLPRADFVILTVPHTPATEGFLHRARFQRMKPSAFFINIGRGMTTRLDDLVAALEAGEIAGAALDVFEHRTAAGRPQAVAHAQCADHPAQRRVSARTWTSAAIEIVRDNCRAFADGTAVAQPSGQGRPGSERVLVHKDGVQWTRHVRTSAMRTSASCARAWGCG